jgi:large subunit ribosomal protein L18
MISRNGLKRRNARRLRRKRHIRSSVFGSAECPRLTVFRSHRNICCQLIDDYRGVTLASASTLEKDVRDQLEGSAADRKAAGLIGRVIAERSLAAGVSSARFDRNGYSFHGRVKALADAAREAGLKV